MAILQTVHCESPVILQMLLLLASSSNSVWEASSKNVSLSSYAKINPCPSLLTAQLYPDFQGRERREKNEVAFGKKEPLGLWLLIVQRNCSSAQKAAACHITEIALFALQSCNTIGVLFPKLI